MTKKLLTGLFVGLVFHNNLSAQRQQELIRVGLFYFWEALHYIPIFGGAFFGETQQDKIGIPLIGLASLFVWKGLTSTIANKYITMNRNIHNSGYKIPNGFEY